MVHLCHQKSKKRRSQLIYAFNSALILLLIGGTTLLMLFVYTPIVLVSLDIITLTLNCAPIPLDLKPLLLQSLGLL